MPNEQINAIQLHLLSRFAARGLMPPTIVKLTLPFPPSSNRYWRKTRHGRVYVSDEAKNYRDEIALLTKRCGIAIGDVSFTAKFYRPRKSGDLDNRIKILLDALQGNCFVDDSQVVEIHAYRFDDREKPRVEVEIREI